MDTLRGWEYWDITPRDPVTGDPIGGEKMMVYNVEFRAPLLKEQGVVGIVFFDTGNVWTDDENASFSDMRENVGLGLRWYSPMGPLRIAYGYKLDREEGEDTGEFLFSMGGQF
jgi:outer membrane protein insertion porin family